MHEDVGEYQPLLAKPMLQHPLEIVEGPDVELEEGPETEGMDVSQILKMREESFLSRSVWNSSCDTWLEKVLLDQELSGTRLENKDLKLTLMQKEVSLNAMTTILELKKRGKVSLDWENIFVADD